MIEERTFPEKQATVTIGRMDGGTIVGRLWRFSPTDMDLLLTLSIRSPFGRMKEISEQLAIETISYVAFHRGSSSAPTFLRKTVALFVHVIGGHTFSVNAQENHAEDPRGFWATPASNSSAFSEIYFYSHGINARENKAALGTILVEFGVLGEDNLARGLDEQESARAAPLGKILVNQHKVGEEEVAAAATSQFQAEAAGRRLRLGEILMEAGLASEEDIQSALREQKKKRGKRIGEVLVEMGFIGELELGKVLSRKFNIPFVDLSEMEVNPNAVASVSPELIQKYQVLPLKSDETSITIAISDPLAFEALDMLRFVLSKKVVAVVAMPSQISSKIKSLYHMSDPFVVSDQMEEILSAIQIDSIEEVTPDPMDLTIARDDDSGVAKLVNQIIFDAHSRGASDIHIEPDGDEQEVVVRFRIDGICETYRKFQTALRSRLVARLKIMTQLDITERRKPQDGKIRIRLKDKSLELRVATIPTVSRDEDVVMRILTVGKPISIENLLLSTHNLEELKRLVEKPYGLILTVGPTGSGKTTTLHSLLGVINTPNRKIWTAEDPVEITQKGLRQVQVQPRIGFNFAAALRAFLRADPDIIMVGEMRDHETASIGIEASLTGHLVFSTLHTNTAPETVTRLVDLGIDPFTFSDALLGILAQRLVRQLCPACRETYEGTSKEHRDLGILFGQEELTKVLDGRPLRLFRARGCPNCEGRGYKGRIALHELLVTDETIRVAIQRKAPAEEIRAMAAAGGMKTLMQDGISKCLLGYTDLRQVMAVCSR